MKRWTWLMALMLALMIPLQGCTSNPPKDEGEEQNQQEQQKEEQEKDEEEKPEEDKEPEDTQAPADEQEDKDTDGDTPVSNQNQSNTSSEKPSTSTQKPQGGGSSSSQGSSNTSQGGGSKPSQGGGNQSQQPQQPQEPQQPEEKPQPALTASQVVSNLLSQHSMGDLTDYNGMVGTLYGGIDLSQMESYCVKGPAMGTTASEIAVFQVKAGGSTASVEKALRQRADDVARTFEQYDPAQYEIAKKAVVRTKGNYVCMVIGSNASAIASSFEKMV